MAGFVSVRRRGPVAEVVMDRPEVHNAFDDRLIAELTDTLLAVGNDPSVRVVVLTGEGASFSAGADLQWMRGMAAASEKENLGDSLRLATLMRTLQFLPKPTVCRVNGAAYGGGVGLIACCDIAIAVDTAKFALTEVKLGLVPAVISPYVVAAIGLRHARRLFLTGEAFGAETARSLGLVHETVAADALDHAIGHTLALLAKGGPKAQVEAKHLALRMGDMDETKAAAIDAANAALIARMRGSTEGQQGLGAFLDKTHAPWIDHS
jgi:methylglutaconyl-CoA hydratase